MLSWGPPSPRSLAAGMRRGLQVILADSHKVIYRWLTVTILFTRGIYIILLVMLGSVA